MSTTAVLVIKIGLVSPSTRRLGVRLSEVLLQKRRRLVGTERDQAARPALVPRPRSPLQGSRLTKRAFQRDRGRRMPPRRRETATPPRFLSRRATVATKKMDRARKLWGRRKQGRIWRVGALVARVAANGGLPLQMPTLLWSREKCRCARYFDNFYLEASGGLCSICETAFAAITVCGGWYA